MTVDLAALARLAAEANPESWARNTRYMAEQNWRDAEFYAACSPGTVLALVEAVQAAQAVAQTHHYGTRFTSNGREAVPKEKLERLREKLAPFGRAGDET